MEAKDKSSFLDKLISFLKMYLICYLIAFTFTSFLFNPVVVRGSSMEPTLEDSDYGFSNVIGKLVGGVNRFDTVVVYVAKEDKYLVKRVIGLPGEKIKFENDALYIDNELIPEPHLETEFVEEYRKSQHQNFTADMEEITLGKDEYFIMGDNRPASADSRIYGPYGIGDILSKNVWIAFD